MHRRSRGGEGGQGPGPTPNWIAANNKNVTKNTIVSSVSFSIFVYLRRAILVTLHQRWSPRGRPWPREHILKSLALTMASKPQVLENCPVLGSRTALFFEPLKFCWKAPETSQKICEDFFLFSSSGNSLKKNFEDLFRQKKIFEDLFLRLFEKLFWKPSYFSENPCACVLGPWPWPWEGLSLPWLQNVFVSLALASSLVSSTSPLFYTSASEVESRTQSSRPRPRTQKKSEAKAKDSLSEDRTSRGQGQECSRPRPRTKDTGASVLEKKKVFKNFFQAISNSLAYPEFLIGIRQHLNCRGDASPHRDLASPQRDLSTGWSDEKDLILHLILAKNRFNFRRRPFFLVFI